MDVYIQRWAMQATSAYSSSLFYDGDDDDHTAYMPAPKNCPNFVGGSYSYPTKYTVPVDERTVSVEKLYFVL
jgi:hypothetical protein